jgi:uncharacterized protein YjbI with pentapeptide repeats
MEILTAYIREKSPWPPRKRKTSQGENLSLTSQSGGLENDEQAQSRPKPATDIQAILTVLRRRETRYDEEQGLHLTGTDLRGADLHKAHLKRVYFERAHLQAAELWDAHLEGARLKGAHLQAAELWDAHLEDADLTGVVGLTKEQLDSAIIDENTILPDYLTEAMKSEAG